MRPIYHFHVIVAPTGKLHMTVTDGTNESFLIAGIILGWPNLIQAFHEFPDGANIRMKVRDLSSEVLQAQQPANLVRN